MVDILSSAQLTSIVLEQWSLNYTLWHVESSTKIINKEQRAVHVTLMIYLIKKERKKKSSKGMKDTTTIKQFF